jgi:hypothetical protein
MPEERKLRKSLGVFDVTAIVSGIIIGAGVFAITGFAAKICRSTYMGILCYRCHTCYISRNKYRSS